MLIVGAWLESKIQNPKKQYLEVIVGSHQFIFDIEDKGLLLKSWGMWSFNEKPPEFSKPDERTIQFASKIAELVLNFISDSKPPQQNEGCSLNLKLPFEASDG